MNLNNFYLELSCITISRDFPQLQKVIKRLIDFINNKFANFPDSAPKPWVESKLYLAGKLKGLLDSAIEVQECLEEEWEDAFKFLDKNEEKQKLLEIVMKNPGLFQEEIAEKSEKSEPQISVESNKLVEKKLLYKKRKQKKKRLYLTHFSSVLLENNQSISSHFEKTTIDKKELTKFLEEKGVEEEIYNILEEKQKSLKIRELIQDILSEKVSEVREKHRVFVELENELRSEINSSDTLLNKIYAIGYIKVLNSFASFSSAKLPDYEGVRNRLEGTNLGDAFEVIANDPEITLKEISEQTDIDYGNVSKYISKLRKLGLVTEYKTGRTKKFLVTSFGEDVYAEIYLTEVWDSGTSPEGDSSPSNKKSMRKRRLQRDSNAFVSRRSERDIKQLGNKLKEFDVVKVDKRSFTWNQHRGKQNVQADLKNRVIKSEKSIKNLKKDKEKKEIVE